MNSDRGSENTTALHKNSFNLKSRFEKQYWLVKKKNSFVAGLASTISDLSII